MYHLNGQLKVSSLTLIDILIGYEYIIETDETNVIIRYKGKSDTITKDKVISYLKERSKPYIYYNNQLRNPVTNISNKYFELLEDTRFNSIQEILDRLVYYKAIYFLVRDMPNVQVLVKNYIIKRDKNPNTEDYEQ